MVSTVVWCCCVCWLQKHFPHYTKILAVFSIVKTVIEYCCVSCYRVVNVTSGIPFFCIELGSIELIIDITWVGEKNMC